MALAFSEELLCMKFEDPNTQHLEFQRDYPVWSLKPKYTAVRFSERLLMDEIWETLLHGSYFNFSQVFDFAISEKQRKNHIFKYSSSHRSLS